MKAYLDLVRRILDTGVVKHNRTGVDALTVPGAMFEHDMELGFPLLTTKSVPFRLVASELEFFIKGLTDKRWLQERNNHIWDEWCNPQGAPEFKSQEDRLFWQKENPDLGALGYSHQWRKWAAPYKPVPFIWTGFDRTLQVQPSEEPLVGKTFKGTYGDYTVISYDGKNDYFVKYYTVKFHKTGYTKGSLNSSQIESLTVWDPYAPSVAGVACVGSYESELPPQITDLLKGCWRQIIQRCYNPEHAAYSRYGAKSVYVANSWLIFENFLRDVQEIDGWDNKVSDWHGYQLDKDIKGGYYSKDTCLWVSREDNGNNTSQNYYFDAVAPDGTLYPGNVGLHRFCREHGLNPKVVGAAIKADCYTHKGWKFTVTGPFKEPPFAGLDQLKRLVERLKTDPTDRRMIVSAWNPVDLHRMALPPCHYAFQVTVIGDKLNLLWNQRSVDVALGLPFNIASYGLLLHLLAKGANLREGRLVGFLADTHIYVNHIDGLHEQLDRTPYGLPHIETPEFSDLFSWEFEHSKLVGYQHHPKIPFQVAV